MHNFLCAGKNMEKWEVSMKKYKNLIYIVCLCVVIYLGFSKLPMAYALSQYGSSGEEVKKIQSNLK